MTWVKLSGTSAEVSTEPVAWADYAQFARDTGRPVPRLSGRFTEPVTRVGAQDATAYAEWLSQRDGCQYRLPTLDEMSSLAEWAQRTGSMWPCRGEQRNRQADHAPSCLTEWLQCESGLGNGKTLRCITYPAWLLKRGSYTPRATLLEGPRSFVTFRLVRSAGA
jgi:formylglycine-generating enzyme required for sulfatase activity